MLAKAVHHLNCDRASGRKAAVSRPQAHSLWPDLPHAARDEIQRLIPAHAAPVIRAAIITDLGIQQSVRIPEDLVRAAAAYAQEALTVGIVLVAADRLQPVAFHLDQHPAKRWMTVHGTHSPDDFGSGHGHFHFGQVADSYRRWGRPAPVSKQGRD
jgi:hypothetical protein